MSVLAVPQVEQRIKQILGQMILETEKAAMLTQVQIVRKAKLDAPVGTPESTGISNYIISESYKKSIRRVPPVKVPGRFTVSVVAGGAIINPNTGREVDYAVELEYGWSGQAPQGVLVPALLSHKRYLLREILKGIRRVK